jgi:hypothetical protein
MVYTMIDVCRLQHGFIESKKDHDSGPRKQEVKEASSISFPHNIQVQKESGPQRPPSCPIVVFCYHFCDSLQCHSELSQPVVNCIN